MDLPYQWTADFKKGIDNALNQSQVEVKLSIEHLDTKRINSPEYYDSLVSTLKLSIQVITWMVSLLPMITQQIFLNPSAL